MAVRTLLLVDDDLDEHILLRLAIEETKKAIIITDAYSGPEAVEQLKNSTNLPELILLDINMPFVNGFETLEMLKRDEALGQIPVVMYSTTSDSRTHKKAETAGAAGFITKPPDFVSLCHFTRSFFDEFTPAGFKEYNGNLS